MPPRLTQILNLIDEIAPPALAEDWDKAGLACGHPDDTVTGIALALDATPAAVEFAAKKKANLLLVHHPPIFTPLATLRSDRSAGALMSAAIRAGVAVYSAHTSFDAARGGLNDYFAAKFGLADVEPLVPPSSDPYVKLVVFCPPTHTETVATAIFGAGGGTIGDYTHCAFRHDGTGSFRPTETSTPYSGTKGVVSFEAEQRLEVRVPKAALAGVLTAMTAAHPYEEVAYDVVPLTGAGAWGIGRIGWIDPETTLGALADRCKKTFRIPALRLVGRASAKCRRIAVCTGDGSSLLSAAIAAKADAYVTGDIGYHTARDAEAAGLRLIDVGHFGSERIFARAMARPLTRKLKKAKIPIPVTAFGGEKDPFATR